MRWQPGVFTAGLLQLGFLMVALAPLKVVPRPRWGAGHEGVRRIMRLMAPVIFGASVAQINILFDTLIASFLVTGSISWLYYSDRLLEFPLGVFGIALATVILPNLSRQHAAESRAEFSATLDWAMRVTLLIAVPATVGLFMLSGPLIATIFFGGEFVASDVAMAQFSLMAYSLGLVGFVLVKVLAPGYFARQDTKTPVRIGVIALVVNMGLNVALVVPWVRADLPGPHAGLALATACSAFLNAGLLLRGLRRAGVWQPRAGWRRYLLQVAVSAGVMAVLLHNFVPPLSAWLETSVTARWLWTAAAVSGGAAVFGGALLAVGLRPAALRLAVDG